MAGYHSVFILHNNVGIASGEADQTISLPFLITCIYRINVASVSLNTVSMRVRFYTQDTLGNRFLAAQSVPINNAIALTLFVNVPLTSIRVSWVFTAAGSTFTISDSLEAIG